MPIRSADTAFVSAPAEEILDRLTRLSDDASWWPGARARGEYGWVELDIPASPFERVTLRASIGPLGEEGFAWSIERGPVVGRAEWWMEPFKDGVIVHHFLDAERGQGVRILPTATLHRRYRWAVRRGMFALKDLFASRS